MIKLFCVLISAAQVNVKTCRTQQVHLSGSKFFLNKKINRRGKKRPTNRVGKDKKQLEFSYITGGNIN